MNSFSPLTTAQRRTQQKNGSSQLEPFFFCNDHRLVVGAKKLMPRFGVSAIPQANG
jgi:hypothetical protein